MARQAPATTVRLSAAEHDRLTALAEAAGVSLADAYRHGARLYLEAITATRTKRGRPLKAARAA